MMFLEIPFSPLVLLSNYRHQDFPAKAARVRLDPSGLGDLGIWDKLLANINCNRQHHNFLDNEAISIAQNATEKRCRGYLADMRGNCQFG